MSALIVCVFIYGGREQERERMRRKNIKEWIVEADRNSSLQTSDFDILWRKCLLGLLVTYPGRGPACLHPPLHFQVRGGKGLLGNPPRPYLFKHLHKLKTHRMSFAIVRSFPL